MTKIAGKKYSNKKKNETAFSHFNSMSYGAKKNPNQPKKKANKPAPK